MATKTQATETLTTKTLTWTRAAGDHGPEFRSGCGRFVVARTAGSRYRVWHNGAWVRPDASTAASAMARCEDAVALEEMAAATRAEVNAMTPDQVQAELARMAAVEAETRARVAAEIANPTQPVETITLGPVVETTAGFRGHDEDTALEGAVLAPAEAAQPVAGIEVTSVEVGPLVLTERGAEIVAAAKVKRERLVKPVAEWKALRQLVWRTYTPAGGRFGVVTAVTPEQVASLNAHVGAGYVKRPQPVEGTDGIYTAEVLVDGKKWFEKNAERLGLVAAPAGA